MDNFCSSTFWDVNQLWNNPTEPDFTYCFEETALLWALCSFLLLLTLPHLLSLWWRRSGKSKKRTNKEYRKLLSSEEDDVGEENDDNCSKNSIAIPCNSVSIVKMTFCLFLLATSVVELASVLLPSLSLPSFSLSPQNQNNGVRDALPVLTVTWLSPAIRVAVFSYLAFLIAQYRKHGVYSSGPLFLFTFFNALYSAITTRTVLLKVYSSYLGRFYPEINEVYLVCRLTEAVFSVGLFLAMCFNEAALFDDKNVDPHQRSGFLGRITFWWFTRMVLTGYKRPLTVRDMFHLREDNSTVKVVKRFERIMRKVLRKTSKKLPTQEKRQYQTFSQNLESSKPKAKQISLGRLIFKAFWKRLLGVGFLKFTGSCLMFANPVVLDYLMTFMSETQTSLQQPQWRGFLYAVLMFTFPLLESVVSSQHDYWMNTIVLRVKQCLVSTIYKKSLRLSTVGRRHYSTGEITNIMSVDSQRVTDFLLLANSIWAAPLQFSLAIGLLWAQVGWPSLAGLVIMLLMLPVNAAISARIQRRQKKVMVEKDRRSKLMNELLSGIKVLKLYAWERAFSEKVLGLRARECDQLYRIAYLTGSMFFAWAATPFLVGFFTFALYVLSGNVLDPNKAFVSLALFNIIKGPMGQLPVFLSNGVTCLVSIRRLNGYLNAAELNPEAISHDYDSECAIRVSNASFSWNDQSQSPTLKNINLAVPHGSLVAIVGTVGAGKSSLLSGILGDMEKVKGNVNVYGKVAYVPQQAWIQNASLKANVLFTSADKGENNLESHYQEVIRACCMEPDIAILADGDRTELGAKGINLSGGQKARISLARAAISGADIYLLDDPLSAVDAHVGKRLFEDVIGNRGLLKGKTRVLATHQVSILNQVDQIVVLKTGGFISERGTLEQLMAKEGGDFAAFMAEHSNQNVEKEEETAEKVEAPEKKFKVEKVSESQKSLIESQKASKPKEPSTVGKLITEETAQTGAVKRTVYFQYIRAIGFTIVFLIFASMAASNVFQVFSSLWLSEWANDGLDPVKAADTSLRDERLAGYAAFGVGEIAASIFSSLALSVACIRASKRLHETMLGRILLAPMAFFDTTPIGRILNRFTKDIEIADSTIVMNVRVAAMQLLRALVALFMISLETPVILGAVLPILVVYLAVQRLYIATSRQLKRLESTTRSPIYDHFSETVAGASSIRAYGVQQVFIEKSNEKVDVHSSCFYASFTAARWLAVRMEFFGYSIVFLSALFAVLSRGTVSPGVAGLAITYSLSITGVLGMFVRASTDLETNIVSIERLIEYSEIESEAEYYSTGASRLYDGWPEKGEIVFEHYQTRYRPGLDLVVKDVSITIRPHEKVGVVGRTGAGKSSLTLALFRIIEAAGRGRILIDGVDISQIGLFELRSKLSIIPQDPVLFTGSLRFNLDPFKAHSDAELWHALDLAHLKAFVQQSEGGGGGLLMEVSEGGENLSVGTRQLVCLARALLRKSSILVLDEATAAVDLETDSLIQETIRQAFADCTILTIAHRLKTVVDYDRILVLDCGRVVEYAPPGELLARRDSLFYAMAKDAKLV